MSPSKILFICTGNYFRSRFAEALFNFTMDQKRKQGVQVNWSAFSRGMDIDLLSQEQRKLPLSEFTVKKLFELKIPLTYAPGVPIQFQTTDLLQAQRIIALNEREHKPYFAKHPGLGPSDIEKIQFWTVDDIDRAHPSDALDLVRINVEKLILQLSSAK